MSEFFYAHYPSGNHPESMSAAELLTRSSVDALHDSSPTTGATSAGGVR